MIPNNQPERSQMIDYMLDACKQQLYNLTKWEEEFILSINKQFRSSNKLTDRQCEILEKIYDKL